MTTNPRPPGAGTTAAPLAVAVLMLIVSACASSTTSNGSASSADPTAGATVPGAADDTVTPASAGRGASAASNPTTGNPAGAAGVEMHLIAFHPDSITVDAGTTITFSQNDPGNHTVTSGDVAQGAGGVTPTPDARFDSGPLAQGATFELTLETPGSYPYYCAIHPATMRGVIEVLP